MFLARVIGQVVATQKDAKLAGRKLLIIRPLQVDESHKLVENKNTIIAVDNCGAGVDQIVMFCQGSSARQTEGMKQLPIDAAVVGLVDTVEVDGKMVKI